MICCAAVFLFCMLRVYRRAEGYLPERVSKKSLTDYEMASRQLPRPIPSGAHKRRPYEWLFESTSGRLCAVQRIPMQFGHPPRATVASNRAVAGRYDSVVQVNKKAPFPGFFAGA